MIIILAVDYGLQSGKWIVWIGPEFPILPLHSTVYTTVCVFYSE